MAASHRIDQVYFTRIIAGTSHAVVSFTQKGGQVCKIVVVSGIERNDTLTLTCMVCTAALQSRPTYLHNIDAKSPSFPRILKQLVLVSSETQSQQEYPVLLV